MKEVPILRAVILAWTLICVFIELGLLVYIQFSLQNVMEEAKNSSETKILEATETPVYLYYKQDYPNINDLVLKTIFDDIDNFVKDTKKMYPPAIGETSSVSNTIKEDQLQSNIDPYFKYPPIYIPEYNSFANKQENDQFNKETVNTDKVVQHPVQYLSNDGSDDSGLIWWSDDDDFMQFK